MAGARRLGRGPWHTVCALQRMEASAESGRALASAVLGLLLGAESPNLEVEHAFRAALARLLDLWRWAGRAPVRWRGRAAGVVPARRVLRPLRPGGAICARRPSPGSWNAGFANSKAASRNACCPRSGMGGTAAAPQAGGSACGAGLVRWPKGRTCVTGTHSLALRHALVPLRRQGVRQHAPPKARLRAYGSRTPGAPHVVA